MSTITVSNKGRPHLHYTGYKQRLLFWAPGLGKDSVQLWLHWFWGSGAESERTPPTQMILWKYKHWLSYSLFKIMISVPERTSSWKLINFRKYKSEHLGISTLYLLLKKCSWVWKTFFLRLAFMIIWVAGLWGSS